MASLHNTRRQLTVRKSHLDNKGFVNIAHGLTAIADGIIEVAADIAASSPEDYTQQELIRLRRLNLLIVYYGKCVQILCGQIRPEDFEDVF